jgi:asparagine synthetase B (glutamine-hydrolysing)
MPGLFGCYFHSPRSVERVGEALGAMTAAVQVRHPHTSTSFVDEHVGLTHVRFAPAKGSGEVAAADDATCGGGVRVVVDGYLTNGRELATRFGCPGSEDGTWHDENLVRASYESRGEDLVADLKGLFNICLYDEEARVLKLFTCRSGARHLYIRRTDSMLAFATEAKALIETEGYTVGIDRIALCDLFNFAYVSGQRSMFEGITLVGNATMIEVSPTGSGQRQYWDYHFDFASSDDTPRDQLLEEGASLLQGAVDRCMDGVAGIGVPLSGGLDSRTILAAASKNQPGLPVMHCSWYEKEARYARQLCNRYDAAWHVFDPLAADDAATLQDGFEISDGNIHCHQFWFLPLVREIQRQGLADRLLDGYLLDVLLGDTFLVMPQGRKQFSDSDRVGIINGLWRRAKPYFIKATFLPEFYQEYERANAASIEAGMQQLGPDDDISSFIYRFSLKNRSNRYSVALPNVQRQFVEYAYPGLDYDLVDFCLRLPPRHKGGAAFLRSLVERSYPDAASVPWAKTDRPLGDGKSLRNRLSEVLALGTVKNYALFRLSGGRLDRGHHGDLNRRFRKDPEYRAIYEGLLRDPRTASRGLIDRAGIDRLIGFVDRGAPLFTVIQSLVTTELWFRRFMD